MDMKKVILTEAQFNKLVEQTVFYDLSELPSQIETITRDINEGKKAMGKLITFLKTINIGNILEEPVKYTKIVNDCGKLAEVYNSKFIIVVSKLVSGSRNYYSSECSRPVSEHDTTNFCSSRRS